MIDPNSAAHVLDGMSEEELVRRLLRLQRALRMVDRFFYLQLFGGGRRLIDDPSNAYLAVGRCLDPATRLARIARVRRPTLRELTVICAEIGVLLQLVGAATLDQRLQVLVSDVAGAAAELGCVAALIWLEGGSREGEHN